MSEQPQDQAMCTMRGMPRCARMKAAAAATSATAASPRITGGLASGGWDMAAGRVERP
jgi:hypothetical protein